MGSVRAVIVEASRCSTVTCSLRRSVTNEAIPRASENPDASQELTKDRRKRLP